MGLLSSQISARTLVPLCRQLATSYGAGIPILRTLQMVSENVKDPKIRQIMMGMHDDIRNGSTLAQAARNQSVYFPRVFIELLASGEMGGRLDIMLRDLANYYEDRLQMRRSIIRMSIYPALQVCVAWFLGTFALMLIGRMSLNSTTPFNLGNYFQFYLKFQIGAMLIFATIFAICVGLARAGLLKWIWGWISTYIWPLAPVTQRFGRARFFRTLSLLIGSGMPIMRAIQSAAGATANPYMERDFLQAIPRVNAGMTLVDSFSACKFMTPETREMLLVGEESGELENALRKASDYQMEEASHAVYIAGRVTGVAVGLAIAAVIGYIVISFYARYFGMIDELTKIK